MKKKFLDELELKLSVLEDDERKDIIDEYNDIIDEKIKHGKTIDEAIKDFGDTDSLVKEILSAYKIKYTNKNKETQFFDKVNDIIKDGADIVVEFFKKLGEDLNDKDFKTEQIVEIIIKSIVVMLILMIPFNILKWILHLVTEMILIYPLNRILTFVFDVGVGAIYFISIILIISSFFKEAYNKPVTKPVSKKTKKEKLIKEEKIVEKEIMEEQITLKASKFTDVLMILVKVFVIIWTLPLIMLSIMSYTSLVVLVYLLIKGVYIIGLVVLVAGISFLLSHLLKSIYSLIYNNGKVYFYPFTIYLMMIALGTIMTFDYALNVKKTDALPGNYTLTTDRIEKNITEEVYIPYLVDESDILIDDTLLDNVVVFEITYSKDFRTYNITETENATEGKTIYIYNDEIKKEYNIIKVVIEDLKDKEVSNYRKLFDMDIKIYTNSNTINKIKV